MSHGKIFLNQEGSNTTKVKSISTNIMKFKGFHKYVGNKYIIKLWNIHKNIACTSEKKNKEYYNICRI